MSRVAVSGRTISTNRNHAKANLRGLVNNRVPINPYLLPGFGVDGFSAANIIQSSTLANFQPGCTLLLIYFVFSTPANQVETPFFVGAYPFAGASKGFVLSNQFNGWYLENGIAGNVVLENITTVPLGLNRITIVWRASDNHILYSRNGSTLTDKGALTYIAPDASCITSIGGKYTTFGSTGYLVSGSNCATGILNYEMSAQNALAFTTIPYTTSRFSMPSNIEKDGGLTFYFNANQWNGVSSSFISKGSSPITFTVTGAPNLTNYSETRIPTDDSMYFDSKIIIPQSGFTVRNAYARLKLSGVNGRNVGIEGFDNFLQSASFGGAGCYSNGAYVGTNQGILSATDINDFILPTGSNKSIEIWEGNQVDTSSSNNLATGYFVTHLRLPVGASLVSPANPPQKRFVLLGDSIMSGFFSAIPNQTSVTAQLRLDFPTSGTGQVTCHSWGGNSLYYEANTSGLRSTLASLLASELDGTSTNYLWIELGTNDYGVGYWTAANFGIAYADLLDKIHAASPTTQIYCQTPFPRVSPGSEAVNALGDTLTAFRSQITTAATSRSSYCTVIDGTTIYANTLIYDASTQPTGRYYIDGIHNVVNGTNDIKSFIKTTLNY